MNEIAARTRSKHIGLTEFKALMARGFVHEFKLPAMTGAFEAHIKRFMQWTMLLMKCVAPLTRNVFTFSHNSLAMYSLMFVYLYGTRLHKHPVQWQAQKQSIDIERGRNWPI